MMGKKEKCNTANCALLIQYLFCFIGLVFLFLMFAVVFIEGSGEFKLIYTAKGLVQLF